MADLNEIEGYLDIDITNKRLRHGKKKHNKNQYYWFRRATQRAKRILINPVNVGLIQKQKRNNRKKNSLLVVKKTSYYFRNLQSSLGRPDAPREY